MGNAFAAAAGADGQGMSYAEQQHLYFQFMFQQYMIQQNAYYANAQFGGQQQQPYNNGRKNWNNKKGKRNRNKRGGRRRNQPKNQQNNNQGSEQKPHKTEKHTLNKDAAVFTPKASSHPEKPTKGGPTKEPSQNVASHSTPKPAEPESKAPAHTVKSSGPRTYANMVGRQQSTEAKSLLTVDRARIHSLKTRGLGTNPVQTK